MEAINKTAYRRFVVGFAITWLTMFAGVVVNATAPAPPPPRTYEVRFEIVPK